MGESAALSPSLRQTWMLRDAHSEVLHKQGLLEVEEISLTEAFGGKIQISAIRTATENRKINK
jgi:hypothetical protein